MLVEYGITGLSYTLQGLQSGITFTFKIKARTAYGYSDYSEHVSVLTAEAPEQPSAPVTELAVDGMSVTILWTEPDNMGSPLLGYRIYVREADEVSFF